MSAERVTFDGITLHLTDTEVVESPGWGAMLAGFEVGSGQPHRIMLALIDTREPGGD